MPSNWAMIDNNFPTWTGEESASQKIQKLHNYIYLLVEQLKYQLNNLDSNNWNSKALSALQADTTQGVEQEITNVAGDLSETVKALEDLLTRIGEVEINLAYLELGQGEHEERLTDLESDMADIQADVDELCMDMENVQKDVDRLKDIVPVDGQLITTKNLIAVYNTTVDFTDGVGYYYNSAIVANVTPAFAQFRAGAITTLVNSPVGITSEDGRLKIVLTYEKTASAMPMNIFLFVH